MFLFNLIVFQLREKLNSPVLIKFYVILVLVEWGYFTLSHLKMTGLIPEGNINSLLHCIRVLIQYLTLGLGPKTSKKIGLQIRVRPECELGYQILKLAT